MSGHEREPKPGHAGHVGFTGVRYGSNGKYTARIWRSTKPMPSNPKKLGAYELVGQYDSAESAARAWDERAKELGYEPRRHPRVLEPRFHAYPLNHADMFRP